MSYYCGVQQSAPQMPVTNLPVSQSAGQQSLPGTVSVTPLAVNPPAPTAAPEKKRLIQQQLVLLLHANKCQRRENQSNGKVRQCSLPHCPTMKQVLSHMATCQAGKSCPVTHCSSSRQIISHWKNCTRCDCPICLPFKAAADRQQQAVNDQAPQCSPQNLNHIQTAQTPQSQVQLRPILQNSASGAMAGQTAENFLLANYLQSTVKTGNVALINPPPVVPGGLPDNPATVEDWHQSVTQDFRLHLVQKIVQAIFPTTDILHLQDTRMMNLEAYARKVEGDMYGAANSTEEYFQLLAEKIYKIQKELENKRQKRMELKLQQILQVGPNLGPVIGGNSETSSPNACIQTENLGTEVFTEVKQSSVKRGRQSPDECIICFEESVNCAFNPCGHMNWCYRCALQLSESASPLCPICRKFIESILRVYK